MYVNGIPNTDFENYVLENEDVIVISYESVSDAGTPLLVPIADVTLLAGAPLHLPLDGFDFEHDALTFSAVSSEPNLLAPSISDTNRSMRINVAGLGDMVFELFDDKVPRVTGAIGGLAEDGVYDGVIFHRVIDDFVIQGGDPTGTGFGDPSIPDFDDQFHVDLQHTSEGMLSMAKTSIDDTNSSQFFITDVPTRFLDFNHSVFGRLTEGENVRQIISQIATSATDRPLEDIVMQSVDIFVDQENGLVSLIAPEGASGQSDITVTVTDANGLSSSRTFQVTVVPDTQNGGPFLADIPEVRTTVNTPVQVQLRAIDPEGDAVTFSANAAGDTEFDVTLDTDTGDAHLATVTVTPPADFTGELELDVSIRPTERSDTGRGFDPDSQVVTVFVEPTPAVRAARSAASVSAAGQVLTGNEPQLEDLATPAIATSQFDTSDGGETVLRFGADAAVVDATFAHLQSSANSNDLIDDTLGIGERRLPSELDIAILTLARELTAGQGDFNHLDAVFAI
jgi:cyclophilin family peptidyl-prolyl cis-trans isomerase